MNYNKKHIGTLGYNIYLKDTDGNLELLEFTESNSFVPDIKEDGKRKTVMRKVFPGYVLVELIMTDDSWYVVRNTPGVTGFIGSSGGGAKPTPLLPEEAERLLAQMGMNEQTIGEIAIEVGELVEVLEGPFAHFQGKVEELDIEKGKVKVSVDMFGRETKMELDFNQIQKI